MEFRRKNTGEDKGHFIELIDNIHALARSIRYIAMTSGTSEDRKRASETIKRAAQVMVGKRDIATMTAHNDWSERIKAPMIKLEEALADAAKEFRGEFRGEDGLSDTPRQALFNGPAGLFRAAVNAARHLGTHGAAKNSAQDPLHKAAEKLDVYAAELNVSDIESQ